MAAKKETIKEPETVEEVQAETQAEEQKPQSSWDIMVTRQIPRKQKGNFFYICVNDRRFEIPAKGQTETLPLPIAEVLGQQIAAEYAADDYAANMPNRG